MVNLSGLMDDAKCFAFARQHRWLEGARCHGCDSPAVVRDGCNDTLAALEKAGALAKLNQCGSAPGLLCIRVNDVTGPFTSGPNTYQVIQGY